MCFIPENDNILDHQFKKLTVCAKLLRSCSTLCSPMDCSLPGSSVHEIFQARILEWIAIPFSRGSSQLRGWTQVARIAGGFFIIWATREAQKQTQNTLNVKSNYLSVHGYS